MESSHYPKKIQTITAKLLSQWLRAHVRGLKLSGVLNHGGVSKVYLYIKKMSLTFWVYQDGSFQWVVHYAGYPNTFEGDGHDLKQSLPYIFQDLNSCYWSLDDEHRVLTQFDIQD